jgi:hypothetical protein
VRMGKSLVQHIYRSGKIRCSTLVVHCGLQSAPIQSARDVAKRRTSSSGNVFSPALFSATDAWGAQIRAQFKRLDHTSLS